MNDHPLQFKYEGLYPCAQTVKEAFLADSKAVSDRYDEEWQATYDAVDLLKRYAADYNEPFDIELARRYVEYIATDVSAYDWAENQSDLPDPARAGCAEELGLGIDEVLMVIDHYSTDARVTAFTDMQMTDYHSILEIGLDDEDLFEKHPPIGVLSHAADEVILFKDVALICPMCHREPITIGQIDGGSFYCGLCGGSCSCQELHEIPLVTGAKLFPFADVNKKEQPGQPA